MEVFWCVLFFCFLFIPGNHGGILADILIHSSCLHTEVFVRCTVACTVGCTVGCILCFVLPVAFIVMLFFLCPQRTIRFGERWAVDE